MADKRGPKLGDSASLWNFTPSPGWTKEEAQILKFCLMKFGVGRWVQILDTGLLPGKLIQQLNGQTQRLLGQQSLAAYTGLQVDIDRIRTDNEKKTDVERKSGLIIWSGPNPTKAMKEQWQKEAKVKYGLTPEQVKDVEEQLGEAAARVRTVGGVGVKPASVRMPVMSLMDADPSALTREQKLQLLKRLAKRVEVLKLKVDKAKSPVTSTEEAKPAAEQPSSRNADAAGPDAPAHINPDEARVLNNITTTGNTPPSVPTAPAPAKGKRGSKRATNDDEDRQQKAKQGRGRAAKASGTGSNKRKAAAAADGDVAGAEAAAIEADIEQLMAMGFTRKKAMDALQEASGNLQGAIEYLVLTVA